MSAARALWQRALLKVKVQNRMRQVIIEGDVTPHAAAAFMVHEAWGWQRGGVEMDGRLLSSTRAARKLYRLFHNYTWARRVPIAVLLILPLLELPAWCMDTMCEVGEGAPSGWYVFLEPNTFHATELFCALCALLETYMMLKMQGGALTAAGIKRMDPVFHAKFFAVGALILDCVVSWGVRHAFRLGGYLRIAIFVLTVPQVRKSVWNVVAIVPKFLSVAVLFVSYVMFGGWLSLAALSGTEESETYSDMWTSICLMMVLLTTANNPDAWLGAYAQHRAWGIFFLAYVCFGNFYLMSLLLATIYGVYREQAGNTANGCERERAACLREAFALLDTQKSGFVSGADAKLFVEALNNHTDIPSVSPASLPALMEIFVSEDGDDDVYLAPAEFEVLVEQLQLKFGDIPNPSLQRSGWGPVFGPLLFGRIRAVVRAHEGVRQVHHRHALLQRGGGGGGVEQVSFRVRRVKRLRFVRHGGRVRDAVPGGDAHEVGRALLLQVLARPPQRVRRRHHAPQHGGGGGARRAQRFRPGRVAQVAHRDARVAADAAARQGAPVQGDHRHVLRADPQPVPAAVRVRLHRERLRHVRRAAVRRAPSPAGTRGWRARRTPRRSTTT